MSNDPYPFGEVTEPTCPTCGGTKDEPRTISRPNEYGTFVQVSCIRHSFHNPKFCEVCGHPHGKQPIGFLCDHPCHNPSNEVKK